MSSIKVSWRPSHITKYFNKQQLVIRTYSSSLLFLSSKSSFRSFSPQCRTHRFKSRLGHTDLWVKSVFKSSMLSTWSKSLKPLQSNSGKSNNFLICQLYGIITSCFHAAQGGCTTCAEENACLKKKITKTDPSWFEHVSLSSLRRSTTAKSSVIIS